MPEPLLTVRDLRVDYLTPTGAVRAVDGVSLDVRRGEILGVAGESGSGKSTLAQAVMRTLPPPGVIAGGSVQLEGRDLCAMDEPALRRVRWKRMAMVYQSAMDALNPVIPVGEQILDALRAHAAPGDPRARARDLLARVGLPGDALDAYAHRLSGGMRQRVGIALALALDPELVILDEPTTALDVIVEREILDEIRALRTRLGFAVLFITHDLGRMIEFSDRIAVLYAARLVEVGPAAGIAARPRHPYTQGLLRATPSVHGDSGAVQGIAGSPPSLRTPPPGCRFHPRCPLAMERCRVERPEPRAVGPDHVAACFAIE